MILYQVSLLVLASLLVLHRGLALPVQDVSDPGRPFQLTVTPALVNRFSAENMTLRCDRNSKVPTEMDQVFMMRIAKKTESGWSLVAEQRDNEDSPVVEGPAQASADITSDVTSAFLEVFWDTVGNDSFGVFMCDVIGFDAKYKVVTEKSSEIEIHEAHNFIQHFMGLAKDTRETVMDLKTTTDKKFTLLKTEFKNIHANQSSLHDSAMAVIEARLQTVETFLSSLTQWPGGFYALLQPKTGCPADLAFYGGTHKYHTIHTQSQSSSDASDSHSSAFSLMTKFTSDGKNYVTIELCEVTKQFNTARWPQGKFCIHKINHRSCPTRFTEGYAKLDTEDINYAGDARNNVASSVTNPYLYFCCQSTGSASTPVQLPTSSPFLLYRHGGVCQAVQGMRVSEEFLRFNTEDSGIDGNRVSGSHPDVDQPGSVMKFHLCYYTEL